MATQAQAEARRTRFEHSSNYRPGITSRVSIAHHPIHPIVVTLPIAFLVSALVTDFVYWRTQGEFWAESSYWLLWAGVITAVVAAAMGMIDFFAIEHVRAHSAGWIHAGTNTAVLLLSIINLWLRNNRVEDAVLPWGLLISALVTILLIISGWYGGELIYRYKVAVFGDVQEPNEFSGSS